MYTPPAAVSLLLPLLCASAALSFPAFFPLRPVPCGVARVAASAAPATSVTMTTGTDLRPRQRGSTPKLQVRLGVHEHRRCAAVHGVPRLAEEVAPAAASTALPASGSGSGAAAAARRPRPQPRADLSCLRRLCRLRCCVVVVAPTMGCTPGSAVPPWAAPCRLHAEGHDQELEEVRRRGRATQVSPTATNPKPKPKPKPKTAMTMTMKALAAAAVHTIAAAGGQRFDR